jgi:hypothetical protein
MKPSLIKTVKYQIWLRKNFSGYNFCAREVVVTQRGATLFINAVPEQVEEFVTT